MHATGPWHVLFGQLKLPFCRSQLSYITLNVVSQACPLRVNGHGRSGVGALDVDVVVGTIVQLQKERKKGRKKVTNKDCNTATTVKDNKSLTSLRFTAFCLAVSYTGVSVTTE